MNPFVFDSWIADAGVRGGHAGKLVKNGFTVLVGHRVAHAGGNLAGNFPVVFGQSRRIHGLSHPLNPPLGVGEGAVLFPQNILDGRTTSASPGGFGQENILDHKKLEVA
jgi:hypothetical protein